MEKKASRRQKQRKSLADKTGSEETVGDVAVSDKVGLDRLRDTRYEAKGVETGSGEGLERETATMLSTPRT